MQELKNYYETWKKRLQCFIIPVWFVLALLFFLLDKGISFCLEQANFLQQENDEFIKYIIALLVDFLAPTSIVYFVYNSILKYINTKGWKKAFPQYDIGGKWKDITTYTNKLDGSGWDSSKKSNIPSPVIIEQTCLSIKIANSVGDDFSWHSIMSEFSENELKIFYIVEYSTRLQNEEHYPEKRFGFEKMKICECFKTSGKPKKMSGQFWHCIANDDRPFFMGDVIYERDPLD